MPKINCMNHKEVRVGVTTVKFSDNVAEVSQEVADVLLSLTGGDNLPEYFLVEESADELVVEPVVELIEEEPVVEPDIESKPAEPKAGKESKTGSAQPQTKKFDWKKGQSKGR